MVQFFWARSASVWIAVLYILMGGLLVLFPGASGTVFVWALAAGSAAYAASHLWRYLQGRRNGQADGGDLFLTILPAAFSIFSLLWPQAILSVLPLVLGCLLLMDGVGKLPLAFAAVKENYPGIVPMLLACILPIVFGVLILFNPFHTAKLVILAFGASLLVDGISDLITYIMEQRSGIHSHSFTKP